jgi:uncharacterized protein (DUF983 family)
MLKETKLYSILFNKCPKCQQGDFFQTKTMFSKNFSKNHSNCPVCNTSFEKEPGFYTGAMYISYSLNVAFIVVSFVIAVGFLDFDPVNLLYFVVPSLVFLTPFFFRISRRIWINLFVDFDKNSINNIL